MFFETNIQSTSCRFPIYLSSVNTHAVISYHADAGKPGDCPELQYLNVPMRVHFQILDLKKILNQLNQQETFYLIIFKYIF